VVLLTVCTGATCREQTMEQALQAFLDTLATGFADAILDSTLGS
jgi:hypothetical protein